MILHRRFSLCTVFMLVLLLVGGPRDALGEALPIEPGSWTLAILPDTQVYAESYPQHFTAQTEWLAAHAESHNIQMVLHEGDIVDDNNTRRPMDRQWDNALASISILDGVVPYALAAGNHDYGPGGNASTRDSLFNSDVYFGPNSAYATQPTVGGFYEAGRTDNSYHTFTAGGEDWLVLSLEFGPRDGVVSWANQVVSDHSDHRAMLVTHAYMYYEEERYDWATYGSSQSWNPHSYGVARLPGGVNDGQELWDDLVSQHENFEFVFSGHVLGDGTGYLGSEGVNGNVVHQMLANFQMDFQGGNGYMRLLEFMADGETVNVRSYSPVTGAYDTMFDQQFTLNRNEIHPPLVAPPPPLIPHAVGGNLVVTGAVDPASNTVDSVSVPQSGPPGVTTLQANRGDYQIAVGGRGLRYQDGVLLASVTENVRNGIRATVEAGRSSFGDGVLSLSVMEAGNRSHNEVNVNTSVAWFMFQAGWRGAHVNGSGTIAAGNGIDTSMLTRTGTGRYELDLGADATAEDGMLFAIANTNGNTLVHASVQPDDTWDLRVQDSGIELGGENASFSLLYLPYDTVGLVGGHYNGSADAHQTSSGSFDMQRLDVGRYQLTVPGETPDTGMLIMTTADDLLGDNYLTYENDGLGNFIIEARDLPLGGLEDTQFVWAFISFTDPISAVPEPSTWLMAATLIAYLSAQRRHASGRIVAN